MVKVLDELGKVARLVVELLTLRNAWAKGTASVRIQRRDGAKRPKRQHLRRKVDRFWPDYIRMRHVRRRD